MTRREALQQMAVVVVVTVAFPISAADSDASFNPKLPFAAAAEPYRKAAYDRDGYVDRTGTIRGQGLGCSAYVSIVLHRMRDGQDWQSHYDLTVHQKYGDEIARHFGLHLAATVPAETLRKATAVKPLLSDLTLQPGMLYLFNVRRGAQGHVGFVRVNSDGTLTQSHYSGLASINGLATGEFSNWLGVSQYRDIDVELYPIPEESSPSP